MAKNKFDFMAVGIQVAAATVGGGAAGAAVDQFLPQLHGGWQGLAMAGLGSVAVGAGTLIKSPAVQGGVKALGLGMCGAGGDRMQKFWIGGGSNPKAPDSGAASGIGAPDYVVVDSEVEDYPTSGYDEQGGMHGESDSDPMA